MLLLLLLLKGAEIYNLSPNLEISGRSGLKFDFSPLIFVRVWWGVSICQNPSNCVTRQWVNYSISVTITLG